MPRYGHLSPAERGRIADLRAAGSSLRTIAETIRAGGSATLTVSPEDAGTYGIRCAVPGDADGVMTGELVVTEEAPN